MAHHDIISFWTNDPKRAAWAAAGGVDRIGLDLETLGKEDRQRGLPTWISPHTIADLDVIRPHLGGAELFVRCNSLHAGLADEIDQLIELRVQRLMLPNFKSAAEVGVFLRLVDGRAAVTPLIERAAALECAADLASMGVEEVHVGLNDLSIDFGLQNRLVVLASDELTAFAQEARAAGIRFGVGGLGRVLDESLPVPSDLVFAQNARLGANGALLARSFFADSMTAARFVVEMFKLRQRLAYWREQPAAALEAARQALHCYAEIGA